MTEEAKSSLNRKSRVITQGNKRSPNRAMLRAVGFNDDDFNKPIIGIANGQSDVTPCNAGLGKLADVAKSEIKLTWDVSYCATTSQSISFPKQISVPSKSVSKVI